jgi:hypothetical protein
MTTYDLSQLIYKIKVILECDIDGADRATLNTLYDEVINHHDLDDISTGFIVATYDQYFGT